MVRTKDDALIIAKEYINQANRFLKVKEAYLFGSFARNEQHEWSDIDVALIIEDFDSISSTQLSLMAWRLASTVSSLIEPVVISTQSIHDHLPGTLAFDILKDGIKITPDFHLVKSA